MEDSSNVGGQMPTGNADHLTKWQYGRPSGNESVPSPRGKRIPRGLVLAKQRCRKILEDPAYEKQLRDRALAGSLPPALEIMLHHYAYGKPIEKIEILDENETQDYSGLTVEQLRARVETLRIAAASANPDGLKVIDVTPTREPIVEDGKIIEPPVADEDVDPSIYEPTWPDDVHVEPTVDHVEPTVGTE